MPHAPTQKMGRGVWLERSSLLAFLFCACAAPDEQALPTDPPPAWAEEASDAPVVLPESRRPPAPEGPPEPRIVPAVDEDRDYGTDEPLTVVRLVYRVDFHVPQALGGAPPTLPRASAELHIAVSDSRLRAQFAGPGWPIEAGSEVRLRRELGGVYVFDVGGGKPLGPGMLAPWFQGGGVSRQQLPFVAVRRPPASERRGPGDLICSLLAEWAGTPRSELERRCSRGGAPSMFRIGPWRGTRTAEVPVELPRSAMRGDHHGPPRALTPRQGGMFMEPAVLGRVPQIGPHRDATGESSGALTIRNDGPSRAIVIVGGVAAAWIDRGGSFEIHGLVDGEHLVSAMRPLGNLALRPRGVSVPGELVIRSRRQF